MASPNKKAGGGGAGRKSRLPYTLMYAGGLRLGLTTSDLVGMPVNMLANMLIAMSPQQGDDDDVRDATQADIAALAR